ncbi:MAG: hypothetical protein AAFV01_08000, partial [Bacteroidota bacterium]
RHRTAVAAHSLGRDLKRKGALPKDSTRSFARPVVIDPSADIGAGDVVAEEVTARPERESGNSDEKRGQTHDFVDKQ